MSKIICDVCGTSYPETAKQCPICGSVCPGDVQRVNDDVNGEGKVSTGYTYVRGGRFSKSNVKKRSQAEVRTAAKPKEAEPVKNPEEKDNRGLVITAIVLLLAIIGVVIYIALRFFSPISGPAPDSTTGNTLSGQSDLSCTGITLDTDTILFESIGEARLLQVTIEPQNTTDATTFTSSDEAVATVNAVGKVTSVGVGTAKITITCGDFTKECTVTVQLPEESTGYTDPTVETTVPEESTGPAEELRLINKDITFAFKGQSAVLYSGSIAKNLITWSSDNESVATFVDGKAVAIASGTTTVHAEYQGQKVSCIIRCSFTESNGVSGSGGGISEDGGGTTTTTKTGVIANVSKNANVRNGPGTQNYTVVGTIDLGTKVTISEEKVADGYTWYKIGENRWVASNYVNLS